MNDQKLQREATTISESIIFSPRRENDAATTSYNFVNF